MVWAAVLCSLNLAAVPAAAAAGDTGRRALEKPEYHFYQRDHPGNNRMVNLWVAAGVLLDAGSRKLRRPDALPDERDAQHITLERHPPREEAVCRV